MAVIAQTPNKNRNLNHDLYQKANYISTKLTDQLWVPVSIHHMVTIKLRLLQVY